MMDVFILICSFIGGFIIGRIVQSANKATKEIKLEANIPKRAIYVEEHQDKLFAYEMNTHMFLCSFTTYQELHDNLVRIDSQVNWIFYEGTRLSIETFIEKHNGSN